MADLFGLPLSFAGVIAVLLDSLVAFAALALSNSLIAHNIEAKKLLIMSVVALFLAPIVGALLLDYVPLPGIVSAFVLPIVVWMALGEVLLKSDMKTKLKVAAVGYVVYIALSIFAAPYLFALLPF